MKKEDKTLHPAAGKPWDWFGSSLTAVDELDVALGEKGYAAQCHHRASRRADPARIAAEAEARAEAEQVA